VSAAAAIWVDRLVVNRGGRRVLNEVTFAVAPGEIVGLIGPNGAGKTTTLAVLSTLLAPHAGEVRIAGHDLRRAPRDVRRSIGRVPQEVALYPTLTGRENLMFFARLGGARAAAASRAADVVLEQVGLAARADEPAAQAMAADLERTLHEPPPAFAAEAPAADDGFYKPGDVTAVQRALDAMRADRND